MSRRADTSTTIERGHRDSFACRVRFYEEPDARPAVDPDLARSWGELSIWIKGRNVCEHWAQASEQDAVHWYLLPALEWFADNWDPMFHEERTPQPSSEAGGAATILDATVPPGASPEDAIDWFSRQQAWVQRHGLQSAASGGLFPRLFVRRVRGNLEFSWDNRVLLGASEDTTFSGQKRGFAFAELAETATVLQAVLTEAVGALKHAGAGSERLEALTRSVARIGDRGRTDARVSWLAGLGSSFDEIAEHWRNVVESSLGLTRRASAAALDAAFRVDATPLVVQGSCRAALLFGSLSPSISQADVKLITRLLLAAYDPTPSSPELAEMCRQEEPAAEDVWQQGYDLAEEIHHQLAFDTTRPIDVKGTIRRLKIHLGSIRLSDPEVRGLSIASSEHRPTIAVNKAYAGNQRPEVLRFTLAHELCHQFFDRYYEREIAMASGPWAPTALEQRANAFAAMFLMPRALVSRALRHVDASPETLEGIRDLASFMGTSITTTIDHLCNLNQIDLAVRDRLREEVGFA